MAKNSTDRLADVRGMAQSNPNSESYEDYNGLTTSPKRNNDVTVGGAEIMDASGKHKDELIRLQSKQSVVDNVNLLDSDNKASKKILANSGQQPNIKDR